MTRSLSAENFAALQARRLVARDFLWFIVKDRITSAPVYDGYWSDVGTISVDVVDPETGGTTTRQYFGSGTLIQVSDIPIVSDLTVQNITITLSQVADRVNDLIRTYECKQGRVELHRGLFDPLTRNLVSAAPPRFVGYIDTIDIQTPKENSDGGVVITCTSHTQELTRANADTRSDASQRLRSATDDFYKDTAVVGSWQIYWGTSNGKVDSFSDIVGAAGRKFLGAA